MKICKKCGKAFMTTKDRKVFCSHKCQAQYAIKSAMLNRKPRKKTGEYKTCIVCNKEFYVRQYRIKKGNVKYCSRKCLAKIELSKYRKFAFQKTGLPHHSYKYINVNGKRIGEHRYIMEQYLGRKLEPWEHVHHINNDPSDNSLDNLVVLSNSDHQREEYRFRKKIISSFS